MTTVADTLALLLPHLPHTLVDDGARTRLVAAGATLPAALSRCIYLECRPGSSALVDLIVDVDRDAAEILAGTNPAIGLSAAQRNMPAWTPIIAFARGWSDRAGASSRDVAGAWLEFDLSDVDRGIPTPSLFVDFNEGAEHTPPSDRAASVAELLAVVGRTPSPGAQQRLRAVLDALPASAVLTYAGVMLARETSATRLCVMGLSRTELQAWLRSVRWPGDEARLRTLMASLADPASGGQAQPAIVHVDVGESIDGAVGLEYPLARHPQLAGEVAESAMLDNLVARRLVSAAVAAALRDWAGYEERTLAHELWPSVIVRRVNHLKLVLSATGALHLKLYLCAELVPRADMRSASMG